MANKQKKMKVKSICCIGAGYVGGPTMAVIALKCPHINVHVVDINQSKIDLWNHKDLDNIPVYEPGLKDIISKTRDKNLFFSTDIESAINKAEMIFLAVNTPTKTYGEGKGMAADLTYVENCAKTIGQLSTSDKIVVEKSTLPVRTAEKIREILTVNAREGVKFEVDTSELLYQYHVPYDPKVFPEKADLKEYRVQIVLSEGSVVYVKAKDEEEACEKAYTLADEYAGSEYPDEYGSKCVHREFFTQQAEEVK